MSRGDMFSRWSDRKRRVAKEDRVEDDVPVPAPAPAPEIVEPETEEEEQALLASLGLPRPEDVGHGDAARFLQAHVPEFLRRRALRTLWKSDPTFAVLDGLNDYDDDFRSPELTQKVIATAYKVGKGIFREVERLPDAPETDAEAPETEAQEIEVAAEIDDAENASETSLAVADAPAEEQAAVYAPRRMTFET